MKKIKTLFIVTLLLFISGCADKVPFKAQEPLENASLVYIYMPNQSEAVESYSYQDYDIRINDKRVEQKIKSGEYVAFHLKPNPITLSVVRAQIEEQIVELNLKAGEVHYLRVRDNLENGRFAFEKVANEIGIKEIAKTGLAGSVMEDVDNVINDLIEVVGSEKEKAQTLQAPSQVSVSKTDELEKAYKLKEQGIITEEEFKTLKTQIITK
jgi:hypothetical protein